MKVSRMLQAGTRTAELKHDFPHHEVTAALEKVVNAYTRFFADHKREMTAKQHQAFDKAETTLLSAKAQIMSAEASLYVMFDSSPYPKK